VRDQDSKTTLGRGADYLTARIKRDRPDIAERMQRGEFRSVRAAAIEAGAFVFRLLRILSVVRLGSIMREHQFAGVVEKLNAVRLMDHPLVSGMYFGVLKGPLIRSGVGVSSVECKPKCECSHCEFLPYLSLGPVGSGLGTAAKLTYSRVVVLLRDRPASALCAWQPAPASSARSRRRRGTETRSLANRPVRACDVIRSAA
jgi:hypothetical protein